ncbi:hypothetical protein Ciccas_010682 [Cichlidogyrus casuarinus]|uniref:Uncharacterized protein n=1 Tax=Cichlidogyrus casuarinus TaxID=1844966 RepID=A0ABD2PV44_9PLAT
MGQNITFEDSVSQTLDLAKRHQCRDTFCELKLKKLQQEVIVLKSIIANKRIDESQTEHIPNDKGSGARQGKVRDISQRNGSRIDNVDHLMELKRAKRRTSHSHIYCTKALPHTKESYL